MNYAGVEIHVPNIKNPQCTTNPGHITISIIKTVSRVSTIIYTTITPYALANALMNIISNYFGKFN